MIRRRVNILCIQEMKWKEQKVKEVKDTGFKLWYTGNTSIKNDVGTVLDKSLKRVEWWTSSIKETELF
jgi:exonuclease III